MQPPRPCASKAIDDVYTDEGPWFMSDEPTPFDQLADAEPRDALIAAIAELPEREQLVIQLYYVEELNLEEIGQVLEVGAARVCQIKKSAHARLKKGLQRRLGCMITIVIPAKAGIDSRRTCDSNAEIQRL